MLYNVTYYINNWIFGNIKAFYTKLHYCNTESVHHKKSMQEKNTVVDCNITQETNQSDTVPPKKNNTFMTINTDWLKHNKIKVWAIS